MTADDFNSLNESLTKNIEEIKSIVKHTEALEAPDGVTLLERTKYLFYSLTKSLVDIGHSIVVEKDFRDPLNRADIFISLAEHRIILSSVVPGVKKAVIAMPKIRHYEGSELVTLISESIVDLHKCLDSFAVFFQLKGKEKLI